MVGGSSVLGLLSVLILHTSSSRSLPAGLHCPPPCRCVPDTEHSAHGLLVNCERKGLLEVPNNIPSITTVLILSFNNLTTLANDSFLGLRNLWELTVSFNNISTIQPNAFAGLKNLYTLSLRGNSLPLSPSAYHPAVFQPLVSLKVLHLENNVVQPGTASALELESENSGRVRVHPSSSTPGAGREETTAIDQSVRAKERKDLSTLSRQELFFSSEKDGQKEFLDDLTNNSSSYTLSNVFETGETGVHGEARGLENDDEKEIPEKLSEKPDSEIPRENIIGSRVEFSYPDEALSRLSTLTELLMDGLPDTPLGPGFRQLTSLTSLGLSGRAGHCDLGTLSSSTFQHVPHVRFLNLSQCAIRAVLPDTFRVLPELYSLDLSFNQRLGLGLLTRAVQSLVHTNLTDLFTDAIVPASSPGITVTADHLGLFRNLTSLRVVSAKFNRILAFAQGVLCSAVPPSLQRVYLEANLLQLLPYVNDLRCLQGLQVLWVNGYDRYWAPPLQPPVGDHAPLPCADHVADGQHRRSHGEVKRVLQSAEVWDSLHHPHSDTFNPTDVRGTKENRLSKSQQPQRMNQLTTPRINDNDEDDAEFYPAPNLREFKAQHSGLFYKLRRIRVQANNSLQKVDLSENHLWEWTGPVEGLEGLKTLYLSDVFGVEVSQQFFTGFPGLEDLDLSGNRLRKAFLNDPEGEILQGLACLKRLTLRRNDLRWLHSCAFRGLAKLESLRLSVNALTSFDVNLTHMGRLQDLDLSDNQLQTLPLAVRLHLDAVAETHSVHVDLSLNPIACTCHNLPFFQWMQHTSVHLAFSPSDFCVLADGSRHAFTDVDTVTAQLTHTCGSYIGVLIGASACCVIAVTLLLGALAYRFRWKLRFLYHASRLGLRRREEQQGRLEEFDYDAFVSFATEDRFFVEGELRAKLEDQQGLRLCIRTRDFLPGQYIASNIVDGVQRSRRTLVVVSRALLASDWCHFELQMALMENLRTGRDVLLFLLYQHVPPQQLSRDMLTYLQANTYMEFPKEEGEWEEDRRLFWGRLAQALTM